MSSTLMHTIPFIEARHKGRKQRPRTIMLRLSETSSDSGAALGIANYWHGSGSQLIYTHYVVDSELTLQCIPDNQVGYDSRFNTKGIISINVCANPVVYHHTWEAPEYTAVLDNAAKLTAQLLTTYKLPVRYVDLLDHRRMFTRGGIMVDARGAWPTHRFLDRVNKHKRAI